VSIAIEIDLHPYGSRVHARTIATMKVWSEPNNKHHGYRLMWRNTDNELQEIIGKIKKTKSAHQNIFHVMAKVLEHAKPELKKLGADYIPRYSMEKG
jgi:hypothetical protein